MKWGNSFEKQKNDPISNLKHFTIPLNSFFPNMSTKLKLNKAF